jgi:hypothetical protein
MKYMLLEFLISVLSLGMILSAIAIALVLSYG